MNAKAISFTHEVLKAKMRALVEYGRCQTRRPVAVPRKGYDGADLSRAWADPTNPFGSCLKVPCEDETVQRLFPPHQHGDRLWVRERAKVVVFNAPEQTAQLRYEDGEYRYVPWPTRLKPPFLSHCVPNGVHREGARHFLEVVDVRAEMVKDISAHDARLEGVGGTEERLQTSYFALYDSIYGAGAHAKDWCWVYTLRKAPP